MAVVRIGGTYIYSLSASARERTHAIAHKIKAIRDDAPQYLQVKYWKGDVLYADTICGTSVVGALEVPFKLKHSGKPSDIRQKPRVCYKCAPSRQPMVGFEVQVLEPLVPDGLLL